ncbi:MAG: ABC transporter ATP-binding protein [Planktomarina sp.]
MPDTCPPRLEVQNLCRAFDGRVAVEDVSFRMMPGQVTCLLGPSGCGKSTTLRMIAGVEHQDSGTIHVDGALVCDGAQSIPPEQRSIGMMFQDFALFPHLSVWENVAFAMSGPKAQRKARAESLLARVNLQGYADKMPHELSGGEQQRVALIRAVAQKPKIMLMDEPFSGLDDRLRDEVRDETLRILREEGTAVLMVTHDPTEAMKMADEIALMRGGRIVQSGAPYTIYNAPVDRAAAGFFSDINCFEAHVNGALAQTPFGEFLVPGHPNGTAVDIVIRPHHLRIEFDRAGKGPNPTAEMGQAAQAHVRRARFLGHQSVIDFDLSDGSQVMASVPSVFLPKPGTPFWLLAPRRHCYVFAKDTTGDAL